MTLKTMVNMKKQVLLFMMALLPVVASAEEVEIDGLWYNLVPKGKAAEVIQYKNNQLYSGDIIIPEAITYEGAEYVVEGIGNSAFSGCTDLTSISIPNSVTTIGGAAFRGCSSLTSIAFPDKLKSVGQFAFKDCSRLISAHITDISAWCNINFSNAYSNPLYYAHSLYLNGEEIKDLIIPNDVTSIGDYAFRGYSSLVSVTLPVGVTKIGDSTFYGCSNLTSITMGSTVTTIGDYAFKNCSGLISVHIKDLSAWCNILFSNESSNPLSYAHSLYLNGAEVKDLIIPNGVTSIGAFAFESCSSLSSITIPPSVKSIGDATFRNCSSLTSVIIPNSLTSIGSHAFENCSAITSIIIPNSLTSIESYAFSCCTGLTSITIPNSVVTIGNCAFQGNTGLKTLIIGNSVKQIQYNAFANCEELTDVFCYAEAVPTTENDAFNNSYIEYATLHVPAASLEAYKAATPWSGFKNIVPIDGDTPIVEKCATPTITYANGKVRFACETEGVEYVPTVTCSPNQLQNGNELAIGGTFTVSVYAVKEGYENSDTATMTINMSQIGDVNADGELNAADITTVVNAILGK